MTLFPTEEPPRATLIKWLRLNLALTTAIVGAVGAGAGALVSGTWRVAQYEAHQAQIDANQADMDKRIGGLENDRHERDERRIRLANDMGLVNQRIGVLEEQAKNIRDFWRDYYSLLGNRSTPSLPRP